MVVSDPFYKIYTSRILEGLAEKFRILPAGAAVAAAAAGQAGAAGGADVAEMRLGFRDFLPEKGAFRHIKPAGDFASLITEPGTEGLLALDAFAWDMVGLSVFHEHGAGLDEIEGNIVGPALVA